MLILNEHLHSYDVNVDKNEAGTGQFITMSFFNRAADLRFSMSTGQAKQLLESLKEALKDG